MNRRHDCGFRNQFVGFIVGLGRQVLDRYVCTGVASMSDQALRAQVLHDLALVVTVKVKPEWINAASSAVQREKRERRVKAKRDATDVVRSTMIKMGIDKEEPFSVSGAIVARLQALNDVMKNRDVGDALTKALVGGAM